MGAMVSVGVLVLFAAAAPTATDARAPRCLPGMAYIRGGDEIHRSVPAKLTPHQKTNPLCIDILETTQADYRECVLAQRCTPIKRHRRWAKKARFPVVDATIEQALAYCAYRGKRLPTPVEWIQATGAFDGRPLPWGDTGLGFPRGQICWGALDTPCEVGTSPQDVSRDGVRDMCGNAREWTMDDKRRIEDQLAGGNDWRFKSAGCAGLYNRSTFLYVAGIRCASGP
jgi:formylglycine-generating enzyme required for sulfatase activity